MVERPPVVARDLEVPLELLLLRRDREVGWERRRLYHAYLVAVRPEHVPRLAVSAVLMERTVDLYSFFRTLSYKLPNSRFFDIY